MENPSFEYTYSARQKQEVEEIRKKYLPKEEDKMEQLHRLHAIPTQKAQAASIALGVVGALTLGTGVHLCMTELGTASGDPTLFIGSILGLSGMAMVALAYPVYSRILKKERTRIAPEILKLTEELLR